MFLVCINIVRVSEKQKKNLLMISLILLLEALSFHITCIICKENVRSCIFSRPINKMVQNKFKLYATLHQLLLQ